MQNIRRGEIWMCELDKKDNNVQGGTRPCLCISSNATIKTSPVVTIIPITKVIKNTKQISHVIIKDFAECGLEHESMLLIESLQAIPKDKLLYKLGYCRNKNLKKQIEKALMLTLGIDINNLK